MHLSLFLTVGAMLVPALLAGMSQYTKKFPGSTGCDKSNEGCEFYVTFMSNIPDQPKNVPVEIFVATYAEQATVTVESANGVETKTVTKNSIVRFCIPREAAELNDNGHTSRVKGVKISADQQIVVYGANKEQYTTDAFLALPENVIGTQYFAVTWFPPVNFAKPDYCEIGIVAAKEATTVEITLPSPGRGSYQSTGGRGSGAPYPFGEARLSANPPRPYPGDGDFDGFVPPSSQARLDASEEGTICNIEHEGRTYTSGETIKIQLNPLEAVQLQAKCDLTGACIKSNHPVSVFSGNARTAVGPGAITRDHLVEQLTPVSTWGKRFVTVPTPRRSVGDYYKIVASEDGTEITLSGKNVETQHKTLNAGEFWQLDLGCQTYAYICATKPVLVAAFVKSQTVGTEPADPAMSLIMPLEQFGAGYTFTTVEGVATTYQNYMTVIAQKGRENSLLLDGVPVQPADGWNEIPGSNATAGYVTVQPGTHTISSSNGDARFAAYIYGAGDRESYFYPTGMCLKSLVCPSTPGCCCSACPANQNFVF